MRRRVVIVLLALALLSVGFSLGVTSAVGHHGGLVGTLTEAIARLEPAPAKTDFSLLDDVWSSVHKNYVNKNIDDQALLRGAVRGLVEGLDDPYSVYFSPTETQSFQDEVEGIFQGVGMEIGYKDKQLVVISPLPNTPAAKAGLQNGDILLSIDGHDTASLSLDDAVNKIRGPKGSQVTLIFRRPPSTDTQTVKITRDTIKVDPVQNKVLSVGKTRLAYVKITSFTKDTGRLAEQAVRTVLSQSVSGMILDLRGNPGGYLDQSITVSSIFISDGVVVSEVDRLGQKRDEKVTGQTLWATQPLAVLVDGGTASAAEIVAGALQDHHRATIIGTTTFGKGSVQDYQQLPDGSSLKLTVAKWLTPSGRSISDQGIGPDQVVSAGTSDQSADLQLEAAEKALGATP